MTRAERVAEIVRLRAEAERADVDGRGEVERCEAAASEAVRALQRARSARSGGALAVADAQIAAIERELRDEARPIIAPFADDMEALRNRVREMPANFDDFGAAILSAIRAAEREADELAVTAPDTKRLSQGIKALRERIDSMKR